MNRPAASALLLVAGLLAACAPSSSSHGGSGSIAAATSSSQPTSVGPISSATPSSTTTASVTSLAYPTPLELARRHAPLYRFNAWVATSSSIANKSEDYFPMSAKGFLDQLAAGQARLVTHEASGAAPGTNELKTLSKKPVIGTTQIASSPSGFAGDEPGTAPVYCHVYEDKNARVRATDGSGSDTWYVEYWLFYGQDASRERVLVGGVFDVGGHKGDWELTTFAVKVTLGAGGAFLRDELVRGYYSGHDEKQLVDLADLERVNDQGQPDPAGAHPVGYVAVGKHATYPQAGYWVDIFGLLPLAIHDEFFLGNGYAWRSWSGPLVDLEDKNNAAEFEPTSFATLLDATLASQKLTDWRRYKGSWGDSTPFTIPLINYTLPFGDSPPGPWEHGSYGSGGRYTRKWTSVKQTAVGLVLGAVPPVVPAPVPVRK